jgi:cytochrome c556
MRRPHWIFAIAAIGSLATAAAIAQQRPDAAIHYRQGLMAVMGWNFDLLGAAVRHTGALDTKEIVLRAERLAQLGPQMAEGFPKPTPAQKGAVTDAAPEIWSDAAGFQAQVDAYVAESKKLVDVAKSADDAQIKAQFRKVSDACKACHDKYKSD